MPITFEEAVKLETVPIKDALELYDSLPATEPKEMIGAWRGSGMHTGHPMDGLLEAIEWYGKYYKSYEEVHPLVFKTKDGSSFFALDPAKAQFSYTPGDPLPKDLEAEVKTSDYKARLRNTEYRGKIAATMIYDNLPINDVFHKVDADTMLGAMDLKGSDLTHPFFFILRREKDNKVASAFGN
ncbi:hypothetical protein CANCADRAFT_103882 [Tortispora caseinolytica NRRL Y-17796]|uniref:DUF4334 domain-containing protein n=1 Tax=Tortispora caseinolytica NRRL Y-17796 TaxID=767744 RepID=A0A1E4TEN9_9ASCO|nr:hypothetical protein CANCADRAFT_103882 [Tortispora caseinolytica NRRL Y-17796]